jgi:hypothetical protein
MPAREVPRLTYSNVTVTPPDGEPYEAHRVRFRNGTITAWDRRGRPIWTADAVTVTRNRNRATVVLPDGAGEVLLVQDCGCGKRS